MNVVIVGYGTAGKHYLDILKKKSYSIYVLDEKIIPKSKYYKAISFKEIKNKKIFFKYAIIASPSGLHFKHAKFFLERNSNVLIEKPFVLKIDHAKSLINLSKKKRTQMLDCTSKQIQPCDIKIKRWNKKKKNRQNQSCGLYNALVQERKIL